MHMTIRRAKPDDVPVIQDCARKAYCLYVERIGREPAPMVADFASQVEKGLIYVIEAGSEVQGYAVCYRRSNLMHLEAVALFPHWQGRGLGMKLISFVEELARQKGLDGVELYTNEKMEENLQYYPRLGFIEKGRKTDDGFNRVYFEKRFTKRQRQV